MAAVPSIGRASLLEQGAIAPEATATQDLYERHGARIHRYCLHQLGSREEAEDAVQTTFMNAFGALGKGVVPESESAWLYKIAENVCLSRRRSSWRRGKIESPADFGVIEEVVASPESRHDELIGIEDALAAMPVQQRRAILLREWQGLSYREIAQELDVSQAAVETLIFRARRSLARGLTEPAVATPKRERRRLRKALHLGDLASLVIGAKALLGGTAAAHAAVAAVTVATVAGVTARPASELVPDTVKAPPVPAATKAAPVAPPAAPPPVRVVEEPRRPVAQEPTAVPTVAATKPKARPAAAKPKAPQARGAHARVAPARVAPARGAPDHAAAPEAPGHEVSATRRAAGGKPVAKPDKPEQPVQRRAAEPKVDAKAKAPKPAAAPKPSSRPRATEPSVSPPGKPKEKALPEAAASRAAAAHEAEPPAESKHQPERGGPPVNPGS